MRYRFGAFELDEGRFELTRDGLPVALQPKPLELLLHLVRRHPDACDRDALIDEVWGDTVVSDSSLSTAVRAVRRALGESADESVIRTVRGRGYALSLDVEVVPEPARAAPSPATSSTPAQVTAPVLSDLPARRSFFGRQKELDSARQRLANALAGSFEILLFAGEPGIGKTRLAEELAADAAQQGVRVVWGRAHESAGQPAFWPWVRVLHALTCEPGDIALLERALGALAPEIVALLPDLALELAAGGNDPEDIGGAAGEPELRPEEARYRRFEAITSFLRAHAAEQPLMIVLDDLHWADESSLELLTFVANELGPAQVLVAATYRDVELFPHAELRRTLASLARAPQSSHTLMLDGLTREEIEQMLASEGKVRSATDWIDTLYERTRGNPFFAREILELINAEDPASPESLPIPPGIQSVLRRRLEGLGTECRELLASAAVIGRDFRLVLLASVADCTASEVLGRLEPAERARIVEPTVGRSGVYSFVHPLVQETLHGDLSPARRVDLQLRIADSLELHAGDHIEPFLSQIAHYLAAAMPVAPAPRALDFALRAAAHDLRLLAFESAVRNFELAEHVLDESPGLEGHRVGLLAELATTRARAGQPEAAADAWWSLLSHARGVGDGEALGRAAVGIAATNIFTADSREEVLTVLREALEALGDGHPALRARVISELSLQLTWTSERSQQIALSAEARDLARASGDRQALIDVLSRRSALLEIQGSDADREESYLELESLSRDGLDRETLASARTLQLQHRIDHAQGDVIDADLERYEKLASELRQPAYRVFCARVRTMRALWRGELERAERLIHEALALGQKADANHAALVFSAQLGALRRQQGRFAELEDAVRDAAERHPMIVSFRCALAALLVDSGRPEEAETALERIAVGDFDAIQPGDPNYWLSLALITDVCCAVGASRYAKSLSRRFEPRRGRYVTVPHVVTAGSGSRYLAGLAVLSGDRDRALALLAEAIEIERRMRANAWLALALIDSARVRLERNGEGDRAAARVEAAEASGIVEECGLAGARAAIDRLSSELR